MRNKTNMSQEIIAPSPLSTTFELKAGLHPLTVLVLLNTTLHIFHEQLQKKIQQAPKLFENAPIVLDLVKIQTQYESINFSAIREILIQHSLIPVGVKNGSPKQHTDAVAAGFAILQEGIKKANPTASSVASDTLGLSSPKGLQTPASALGLSSPGHAKLVTTQVRSGQQVYAKGCDLIVLGPISQGAELLSDGHIHVYGPLRGRALAGVNGNKEAHIFCHSLEAELISIAGHYKLSEDIEKIAWRVNVDVSLVNGQLDIRLI
jgi:septum site-determining protein MinC